MTSPLIAFLFLPTIRLEAEDAQLQGPHFSSERAGFSGKGYVTDLTQSGAKIVWRLKAPPGLYLARIRFATPGGEKGFEVAANGFRSAGMFPASKEWATQDAGLVELKAGENEVSIERGWGYYDVDYLELTPAPKPPKLKRPPSGLADRAAAAETRALYARLLKDYGARTWSGQYDAPECAYIRTATGKTPAILGGDLMDFSPSRLPFFEKPPADPIPDWIAAARAGQTLTLSWHWNAPNALVNTKVGDKDLSWYRGFYTEASHFDLGEALAHPDSEAYRLILRDIDAIAVPLRRLADAHVPILWRPLHEAEGGWFWWGAKGAANGKALYRLVFDRLTQRHGLHNLIWVWNSPKTDWYPGDDVVDVMSVDQYPSDRRDALSGSWEDMLRRFNGRKPIALAEFPGAPDVERMRRFGVRWLYFVAWTGGLGPKSTPPEILKSTYLSPSVVNGK